MTGNTGWKFSCEQKAVIPLPPDYSFAQAFNYLNPKANSFYILEKEWGYIQCAGSKKLCTVELRESFPDGTFKHYVFFDPKGASEPAFIPMTNGGVTRQRKHCLHFRTAIELFSRYFKGEPWPSGLELEDITNQFLREPKP